MTVPFSLISKRLAASEFARDVYFRIDFMKLHSRTEILTLKQDSFSHGASLVPIKGTDRFDLETPWGYGGPIAEDKASLLDGIREWRSRQTIDGRVAEFIRFHPALDISLFEGHLQMLAHNRQTVMVELAAGNAARWKGYSGRTRTYLRSAERVLNISRAAPEDAPLVRSLYESGLLRNQAAESYFLNDAYFRGLLEAQWCTAWIASDSEGPVSVACFLHTDSPICHYHLSGGNERSRKPRANYLLLEHAFKHFAEKGYPWMHLGGGRTPDPADSLLEFKSKFSPVRADYYVGGLIYDKEAYEQFGDGKGRFLCAGV